jgi:putative Holliday junction resolvase
MRILGLDIGDKRIGVAISDPEEILASPFTTIYRDTDEKTISAILELIKQNNISKIVFGLPYSMDGTIGSQANKVLAFMKAFSDHTDLEILTQDERLSTRGGKRLLAEAGHRGKNSKQKCDAAAAAFVLQGYLDSLKTIDV